MYSAFQVCFSVVVLEGAVSCPNFYFQSNNDDETVAPFALEASGMRELVDVAALNSRVKFDNPQVRFEDRTILGDATETGLTRFAGRSLAGTYDQHVQSFPKVFEGASISVLSEYRNTS